MGECTRGHMHPIDVYKNFLSEMSRYLPYDHMLEIDNIRRKYIIKECELDRKYLEKIYPDSVYLGDEILINLLLSQKMEELNNLSKSMANELVEYCRENELLKKSSKISATNLKFIIGGHF